MASPSTHTWLMSLKVALISTGVLSVAMVIKFSVPSMVNFAVNEVPVIWSSLLSWLRPPYLYFIMNGIIITIAASSRFYHHKHDHDHDVDNNSQYEEPLVSAPPPPPASSDLILEFAAVGAHSELRVLEPPQLVREIVDVGVVEPTPLLLCENESATVVEPPVVYENIAAAVVEPPIAYESETESTALNANPKFVVANASREDAGNHEDEVEDLVISNSIFTPMKTTDSPETPPAFSFPAAEKPLISARFGRRKPMKPIYEGGGRALRVAKPKKQETLESTWKMITEGRHVPLTRHLKKCENSSENHGHLQNTTTAAAADDQNQSLTAAATTTTTTTHHQHVVKSETFRDRANYEAAEAVMSPSSAGRKIRREPSLSQDELNRRVEAFIKKFNEEMRLQREESLNQLMEMINRGAH